MIRRRRHTMTRKQKLFEDGLIIAVLLSVALAVGYASLLWSPVGTEHHICWGT
jgi:hypothetical protein